MRMRVMVIPCRRDNACGNDKEHVQMADAASRLSALAGDSRPAPNRLAVLLAEYHQLSR